VKIAKVMKQGLVLFVTILIFAGCYDSSASREAAVVDKQQDQFNKSQPIPVSRWSLERDLLIKLYKLRNRQVSTHSVWRSAMGQIEGDCPSIGFGLPYDLSLTNPLMLTMRKFGSATYANGVVAQPEPNGIFSSTNTNATWVMCVDKSGLIEPHYIEAVLNVYPYELNVNYKTNRVVRVGSKSVKLK
jgi:hypothetical protein